MSAPHDLSVLRGARWDAERATAWDAGLPWLVGGNFTPSTASNQLEMWQEETFDPVTIDRELGWAAALGMTSMRIFLHDLCWSADRTGFLARIDRVLAIAARHRIGALLVFFDSCWNPHPRPGPQPEPRPHIHNSCWVQSPGTAVLRDPAAFAALKPYVQGVMQRFRSDPRIHGWDLWNEPENANAGKPFADGDIGAGGDKADLLAGLVAQVFAWAREVDPSQPLTSGVWNGDFARPTPLQRLQLEASDIVSFHCYGDAAAMRAAIGALCPHGRPLWCSEYMARPTGSTFQAVLPILAGGRIAAWNWGLVAGRTQTQYAWDSWQGSQAGPPPLWFHEVLHPDGRPYDEAEARLIRALTSGCNGAAAQTR